MKIKDLKTAIAELPDDWEIYTTARHGGVQQVREILVGQSDYAGSGVINGSEWSDIYPRNSTFGKFLLIR